MIDKKTGKVLQRSKPYPTKNGIVFTSEDGKIWQIDYPLEDDKHRYGANTTAERVAIFFLLLSMGHSLDEADRIAFKETNIK